MTPIGRREPVLRPATPADLPAAGATWRDAINDYIAPLNQQPIPDELRPIGRLHAHLQATDPERFWVATTPADVADGSERVVAFVSAYVREPLWFLSMLFVRPEEQRRGLGRRLLGRVLPDPADGLVLATATDSLQPISNALYSTYGIVPRMPLINLVGRPEPDARIEGLPAGVRAVALDADGADDAEIERLDRERAGFSHPQDHAYVRAEGRRGWLYRGPDGSALGYGYASEVGRVGPVAVRDDELLAPVLGHLLTAVAPRGASAVWVPGHADRAVVALLQLGLRFEGFPVLLGWTRPFADFSRYLPISPGLL